MFKEIFTRLIRHLPSRLVHRDPLPGAQQTVNTAVPPSLSAHCLKMAVMPEEELWKTFDTHPEGLNQRKWNLPANNMVKINYRTTTVAVVGTFMGLLSQPL